MTVRLKEQLQSTVRWISVIQAGLDGKPESVGEGAARYFMATAEKLGLELLSLTKAKKQGLELKRGQTPIVYRYYGAPLQVYAPLYLRDQFRLIKKQAKT